MATAEIAASPTASGEAPPGGIPATMARRSIDPAQRAGILVAVSGATRDRAGREISKIPFGGLLFAGALTSFRVAMTTGPMKAVEQAITTARGGPAITPEEVAAQRRIMAAASAATVVAGVVTQRLLINSGRSGPAVEVGRVLGSQLAVGGAAGAVVLGTDALMRTDGMRDATKGDATKAGAAAGILGLVILGQRRAVRGAAEHLTLRTPPSSVTLPVRGRLRTLKVEVPIR